MSSSLLRPPSYTRRRNTLLAHLLAKALRKLKASDLKEIQAIDLRDEIIRHKPVALFIIVIYGRHRLPRDFPIAIVINFIYI